MERTTIGAIFDRIALGQGEREALVFPAEKVRWTYRELHAHVNLLAKGLMGLGVAPGEALAIWAGSRPEWILLQLAAAKAGAVLVPVDPALGPSELSYVLAQAGASTLVLAARFRDVDHAGILVECCPELRGARPGRLASRRFPALKRVVFLGDGTAPGAFAWPEVLNASAGITDHLLRLRQDTVDPLDPATIQYTAGTSGTPKGAELTHLGLVNGAVYAGECMRLGRRDRVCVPVPLARTLGHVLGTLTTIARGATMVVPGEVFDAEATLAAIASERCTALHGLPGMFVAELAQRRFHEYDLSTLRTGVVAGGACPRELLEELGRRMHLRELTVAYGQTEATPLITQTRADDPAELRMTTVGRALPHTEVRIVDPASGREVPRGTVGELRCRGFIVMRGYHDMPDASAAALDPDGWLRTGDLASMDEQDNCRIAGRMSDLVMHAGEQIFTREVEDVLHRHPKVREVQVFGVPDTRVGEEVAAWIRLVDDTVATEDEIREHCRGRIADSKIPRYVRFVDTYPTTINGTVRKYVLRDLMTRELAAT